MTGWLVEQDVKQRDRSTRTEREARQAAEQRALTATTLPNRVGAKDENTVARYRMAKDSFNETNSLLDVFILNLFTRALDGSEGFTSGDWPLEERIDGSATIPAVIDASCGYQAHH